MKLIRMILIAALCLVLFPVTAVRADSSEPGFTGNNFNRQNYDRWAKILKSNLVKIESGYMIVHANSGSDIKAAYYDDNYVLQRTVSITDGLPRFGGFHAGKDGYYYIVTGQNNSDESADVECYRITKYDSSWNIIGSAGLKDCNTTIPFEAGTCRMADQDGYLLVHTCHQMYKSKDGLNHQANLSFLVKMDSVEVIDAEYEVSYGYAYVSHSFNQFVKEDGQYFVTVDHSDAFPERAINLARYNSRENPGVLNRNYNSTFFWEFAGEPGDNATNASIGGLEVSSTHYLIAANSAAQQTDTQKTRNVFVSASDRMNIDNTEIHWLTSLEETGSYTLTTPKLVDLKNDTFMVLWADIGTNCSFVNPDTVYWTIVDHEGKPVTGTMTGKGILTDCDPMVKNNKVVWYAYEDNDVFFEEIDLVKNTLSMIQAKKVGWKDVQKINLNETDLYLSVAQHFDLLGNVEPEDADGSRFYYASLDPSIATVTEQGRVRAVAAGETVIRVRTANGVYADCKVTVAPSCKSMAVTMPRTVMKVGSTQQLDIETDPAEVLPYVHFTSSDPSVLTVSSSGLITAVGLGTAEVRAFIGLKGVSYTIEVTENENAHKYVVESWEWAPDYSSATVYLVCTINPAHKASRRATVTAVKTDPTCTTEGSAVYTARATAEGQRFVTSKTVTLERLPHSPGTPSYTWLAENAKVTASAVCSSCGNKFEERVKSSYEIIQEPTCTEAGSGRYTASFRNSGFTTQTKDVTVPALGHSYVLQKWIWSDDWKSAEALFVCEHDSSHTETVMADVTEDNDSFTASVSFEGKTYTATKKTGEPSPESISLNRTSLEMATETNTKLTASIQPSDSDQTVTWTSSDENIAKVDSTGTVTALRYGKVTITASSKADSSLRASCSIQTRFYDVNDSSKYYYKPVYWAADSGITTGYDRVYFGPQRNCTRRELSIFLWRLAGKPAASGSLPFSDTGKYAKTTDSYKAILWCYTNGIVKGYSDGTFRPDNPIVRKDTMIMLYRLAGKPSVSGTLKFPDARALGYGPETDTYKSIVWGTQNGITNGYADGSFKPLVNCLREHIVTFVYRYDQKYN